MNSTSEENLNCHTFNKTSGFNSDGIVAVMAWWYEQDKLLSVKVHKFFWASAHKYSCCLLLFLVLTPSEVIANKCLVSDFCSTRTVYLEHACSQQPSFPVSLSCHRHTSATQRKQFVCKSRLLLPEELTLDIAYFVSLLNYCCKNSS